MMPPQAAAGTPDGLGYIPQQPTTMTYASGGRPYIPQQDVFSYDPLAGQLPIEPTDTSSGAAVQSAGVAAVLAAAGITGGLLVGGPWGAGSGLMFAGAVANGYRAQKWMSDADPGRRHEAIVSATFSVFQVGFGAYLAYRSSKAK